jgi:spore coat protein SA
MGVKPRVAIITPGSYPIPSSKSSSVENVVKHIGALMGGRVSLWVMGKKTAGQPRSEIREGVRYIRPIRSKKFPTYIRAASAAAARLRPDIIQVENRPSYVLSLKRRGAKRQVWLSLHSTTFISPRSIKRSTLGSALRQADLIIVNSYFLKDYVAKRFPRFSHKIRVNYLGVDMERFIPRWSTEGEQLRAELLGALGYEQRKILLYVGRLIEKKGVHHLLHAMPAIIERHPDALLIIVGSADYGVNAVTPYVKSLHALGNTMPGHVRFIQYVPHDQVHRWFCLADAAVVPSFREEAFGLVNVEAMACGVPVIATRAGGMIELIVDGETGFLISPNNIEQGIVEKACYLFENQELARLMGDASIRRVAEHFTWQHAASRMANWYTESAARRRRRR